MRIMLASYDPSFPLKTFFETTSKIKKELRINKSFLFASFDYLDNIFFIY